MTVNAADGDVRRDRRGAGSAITPVTMIGSGGTGGPYTFSATGLPTGLTMSTTGTISGTPTVTGTFNYTVTVTDKDGNTGTINCSVTVNPPPSATCVAIVAVQGVAITPVTMIGSGGTGGPYTFTATGCRRASRCRRAARSPARRR